MSISFIPSAETSDDFAERLLKSAAGLFEMYTIHIGGQLGFYDALAQHGPVTSVELAERTNTQERYVREWLEQQTVVDILCVDDETAAPQSRLYGLSDVRAQVLANRDNPNFLLPLADATVGAGQPVAQVINAFRHGGGVPYSEYGRTFREGQAGMNRNMFLQELGQDWLASMPDIHARLSGNTPARIADIGCGAGWSSIGMAQSYPNVRVDGFDLDKPSVEMAWRNASDYGLTDRITFHARDAGEASLNGRYDLVAAFECIHDMGDPVSVLSTMRRLANSTGSVLVMDERVGDTFTAEGNDVEWLMYSFSVLHCLPVGMAEHNSVGTGTVMRTETMRDYALAAGFREVEVLPLDNFFFRLYRLHA